MHYMHGLPKTEWSTCKYKSSAANTFWQNPKIYDKDPDKCIGLMGLEVEKS